MRWQPGERSSDLEDRRGESGGRGFGGGGGGLRLGFGGFVVLLILSFVFKTNFFALLDGGASTGLPPAASGPPPKEQETAVDFVSFVLDDVQATWARELPKSGKAYRCAKLVLFTRSVASGCGSADSAMGPFYCPADEKVYVDLSFYEELKARFGAPGDFAQAYVIAHELGHHVQNILGIDQQVRGAQESRPQLKNELSVRMELQADCLAGIWGSSTKQRSILEQGDVEEALGAAAAIGDDRLQKSAGRRVNPESFTHGSSRQRVDWFNRGFTTGQLSACDTFRAPSL